MEETGLNVTKECTKCGQIKSLDDFWTDRTKPSGKHSRCVDCSKKARKAKYCPERNRDRGLKYKYGIDLETFSTMLDSQEGLCEICGDPTRSSKRLCVDHCHTTGEVRGLLCSSCNKALGLLDETPEFAKGLIKYIRKYK